MKIFVTKECTPQRGIYFPDEVMERLKAIGEVTVNPKSVPMTEEELKESIKDVDICVTHWASPAFTENVLKNANRLKLIAHFGSSVGNVATEDVYARGIKVISGHKLTGKSLAEGALAYMLSALRYIPEQSNDMRNGYWINESRIVHKKSLFEAQVGLIGLGVIGKTLVELLKPFDVKIKVYDPYLEKEQLPQHPNIAMASLEEVISWGDVISIHASLTEETRGMLNTERLKLVKDGALLVNTARGAIIDEKALITELGKNRFRAILDVYEKEPLEADSPLRKLDNVIIMPHSAGAAARNNRSNAVLEDIEGFAQGKPLEMEIPFYRFKLMTKE